ncbi:unnamed protein product [Alopecurus aequalis]
MPRHLLQQSVDRLAEMAAPPMATANASGVHTGTLLILAAVCFLLCVLGLALVARCSRLCNPSAFSVDAMPAMAPCIKGMKKKALQSLPTVSWVAPEQEEALPECAICLAEFATGDVLRVLPPCGHGFHAACVDAWLMSSATCPSCRRAFVVPPPLATEPPALCSCAAAQATSTGRCRPSVP